MKAENTKIEYKTGINAQGSFKEMAEKLYARINNKDLSATAFHMALKGYFSLREQDRIEKKNLLTIVDFSQSSNNKRFFVLDIKNGKVLYQSLVAHGKNSGEEFAKKFSNIPESNMSSLGFYVTGETYHGKHGLSMKLDGMDLSFNDKARDRAIVVHGAEYVSNDFIRQHKRLGRSQGCPALPESLTAPVINTIKGKSCLFIYYPDKEYTQRSACLNPANVNIFNSYLDI